MHVKVKVDFPQSLPPADPAGGDPLPITQVLTVNASSTGEKSDLSEVTRHSSRVEQDRKSEHQAKLHHHRRYLHPCYRKGLENDDIVKVWAVINMVSAVLFLSFAVYHLLISIGTTPLPKDYTKFFEFFHGLECHPPLRKTALALTVAVDIIYTIASILLILAVFTCKKTSDKVHLSNWFMHLSGLPLVGILPRIPIGIASRQSCSPNVSSDVVVAYWISNVTLFIVTGVWLFYMHSIAHLYIHWLKMPIPPKDLLNSTEDKIATVKDSPVNPPGLRSSGSSGDRQNILTS